MKKNPFEHKQIVNALLNIPVDRRQDYLEDRL